MKELDKDALLEEAKKRYPIGTKFKSVKNKEIYKVETNSHRWCNEGIDVEGIPWVYLRGKWAEIVEEPKVEIKFEKGKWYKWFQRNHDSYHYGKFYIQESKTFTMRSWICHCKIYEEEGTFDFQYSEQIQEVPLSEIQQYLPADHPDKIKQEVKEEVKPIEEWSVGSYAVALQNGVNWNDTEKGDIYLITLNGNANNLTKHNNGLSFSCPRNPKEFKWFPTLQEAQKFSDALLGKSKTGLGVEDLVKGEIYIDRNNIIFMYNDVINDKNPSIYNDKFHKIGGTISIGLNSPFKIYNNPKWLKTCIKQDKFIPKEELDKYDDEGNLMESEEYSEYYECVNMPSINKNWIEGKIYKIRNSKQLESYENFIDEAGEPNGFCPYNHEHFKPSTKEAYEAQFKKDEEFKIGDKVICIQNEGFKSDTINFSRDLKIGQLYTVTSKAHKYCNTKELGINIKEEGYRHPIFNFRKVLPHEIPVENSTSRYPLTPIDCCETYLDEDLITARSQALRMYVAGADPVVGRGREVLHTFYEASVYKTTLSIDDEELPMVKPSKEIKITNKLTID